MENSIKKEIHTSPVSVDKIYTAEYQKEGTKTAQLRQKVTTKAFYPSTQISNSHQDNPFALDDFGFEAQEFSNTEERVAWINIPEAISSTRDVEAKLPKESVIYRILSNRPILTESQVYAVESEELDVTLDDIADNQVVRYPKGHEEEGQIIPDPNGKPQYRQVFYSNKPKEDVDLRNDVAHDLYLSPSIRAEMMGAGAIVEQDL